MTVFAEIGHNINEVINTIDEIIVRAMVDNKEEIIDLNVSQLEKGIGSDGDQLGEYASDEYAELKQSLGSQAPAGVVDTKLTGDFHEGFYAEPYYGSTPESSGLFINSRDDKTDNLQDKYPTIFGIAPDNEDEVKELILETVLNQLKNEITNIR